MSLVDDLLIAKGKTKEVEILSRRSREKEVFYRGRRQVKGLVRLGSIRLIS